MRIGSMVKVLSGSGDLPAGSIAEVLWVHPGAEYPFEVAGSWQSYGQDELELFAG